MLSLLSFKDEKDLQQQRQYYKNTCQNTEIVSPKQTIFTQKKANQNVRQLIRLTSKSLSIIGDYQGKEKTLKEKKNEGQIKYKNLLNNRQTKKKFQSLDQNNTQKLLNQKLNTDTKSNNDQVDIQNSNLSKNQPKEIDTVCIADFISSVNVPSTKKSKSVSFQQYFSKSTPLKQNLSKQGQIHQGRKIVKKLVSFSQQDPKIIKDNIQNAESDARIYNLQRIQSMVLKRNNYILEHDVKDYKETLNKKFENIKQQNDIKNENLNDIYYQFKNIKNGFQRAQSAKISPQRSYIQHKAKQVAQDNHKPQKKIEEDMQNQEEYKSYDQIVEQVNLDFIEVNYPYKDDIYKVWRQSKSTIDHINQYESISSSPQNQKSINYSSFTPYKKRIASAKSQSISYGSNQYFSQIASPINSKQINFNLSELVNEAKIQLVEYKRKNNLILDQQNEQASNYRSQETTLTSTQMGSPNLNFLNYYKDLDNNQIDNIEEKLKGSDQNKYDISKKSYLNSQLLSPDSSPRVKILGNSENRKQSNSMNIQFSVKRSSFQEENYKNQPHLNIQSEIAKIYQNNYFSNKKQQNSKNETLKKDINKFLFQNSQIQKKSKLKQSLQIDKTSLNQSFQSEIKINCKTPQDSSRNTHIKLENNDKQAPTSKNAKQQKTKNTFDLAEVVRLSYLNQIQMKKKLKEQQQYIEFKSTKNKLTQKELTYFSQQRKKYFEPLQQNLDEIKMEYGNNEDKFFEDWGVLLQKTNYDIYESMNDINIDDDKNYTIKQTYICREENGLFSQINEINNFLKICNKNLTRKFARFMVLVEKQNDFNQKEKEQNRFTQFRVCDNKLNLEELDALIEQFQLDSLKKNYSLILEIVQKLQFFKKFSIDVNHQIINIAQIKTYEKNEFIFSQGDLADNMYIILKGSVHVRIKRQEDVDAQLKDPVITTIYDGFSFGDLALINLKIKQDKDLLEANQIFTLKEMREYIKKNQQHEKNSQNNFSEKQLFQNEKKNLSLKQKDIISKFQNLVQKRADHATQNKKNLFNVFQQASNISNRRSASIEAAEKCYLLSISREDFTSILLNLILSEMEDKLNLLKKIPFLSDLDYTQLITLANYIEIKQANLGDVVVREGQEPQYFYIIKKGKFEIVKEEIIIRKKEKDESSKDKKHEKRLDFSQQNQVKSEVNRKSYDHDFPQVIQDNYFKQQDEVQEQLETDNQSLNASLELDFYQGLEGQVIQEKPKERSTFKRGNLFSSEEQQQKYEEIQQAIRKSYCQKDVRQNKKIYENDEELAYCYFHQIGTLQEGDIFMIRSFISEQCKVDQQVLEQIDYDPNEKSRLTIISESNNTEIGMIDKKFIHLIAPHLKRVLLDGLISLKDFDHQFNRETREWIDRWDNLKVKIYQEHKKYK